MERYRLKGQITVLASIVLGFIATLAVVCVRSAASNISILQANGALNLGIESVFSEYLRPLFDRYAVFGFTCQNEDTFKEKLSGYMSYNLGSNKGMVFNGAAFYNVRLSRIEVEEMKTLTADDGKIFARQVTDYMKYRVPLSVIEKWTNVVTNVNDQEAVDKAYEDYLKVVKRAAKIDERVMEIVEKIDVIKANTVANQLKKLDTELVLIQAVYYSKESMGTIKDSGFFKILKQIIKDAESIKDNLSDIEKLIVKIRLDCEELKVMAGQAKVSLEADRDLLSEAVYEAYHKGYEEFMDYEKQISVINPDNLLLAIPDNLIVLEEFNGIKEMKKINITISNLQTISSMIHEWEKVFAKFNYEKLIHSHEGSEYSVNKSMGLLESLETLLMDGIVSFTLPEGRSVSAKYAGYVDLASETVGLGDYGDFFTALTDSNVIEDILFNEYVIEHFDNFVTTIKNPADSLEYQVEYILNGSRRDKENISAVIESLALMRCGFNLAHIISNSIKREEAYLLSATILGFTGVDGIIRLGQCIIMYAWGYSESINDVKILLSGGKVPLVKNSMTWKMSLEDMLAFKFPGGIGIENGLDYEGYLRILLYINSREKKYYRTMDMIEIGMEDAGYRNVRLSKLYAYVAGTVLFKVPGTEYEHEFTYGY